MTLTLDWYSHPIPLYRDRYRLMKTVHEVSLLILSLLIILDYFITDWFYNIVFKR